MASFLPSLVVSQKLYLTLSPDESQLQGRAELEIEVAAAQQAIGLHCFNLRIAAVTVDGVAADYTVRTYAWESLPHALLSARQKDLTTAVQQASEHTVQEYRDFLEKEIEPELIIQRPKPPVKPVGTADAATAGDAAAAVAADEPSVSQHGVQAESEKTVRLQVVVYYSVEKPECGVVFCNGVACTQNTLRRARAWMPCVDSPSVPCRWDLILRAPAAMVVVAAGELKDCCLSDDASFKVWHFQVALPVPPCRVGFAAGSFRAVVSGHGTVQRSSAMADKDGGTAVMHFAMASDEAAAEHTCKPMHLAFRLFEHELGTAFPFPYYQQVFVPAEACVQAGVETWAAVTLASNDTLACARSVEDTMEARLALAHALARQWFGVLVLPKHPCDEWVVDGLASYLEAVYIRKFMGVNELLYRRQKERQAVCYADDGHLAPLCSKKTVHGWLPSLGTDVLHGVDVRRWKAAAVVSMLEQKVGPENFKKFVERMMVKAVAAAAAGGGNVAARCISTSSFLADVGKIMSIKKEVAAMAERWVYGSGCPRIECSVQYRRKRNELCLNLRQEGSAAALKAIQRAIATKDGGAGAIKVQVNELEGLQEHTLQLGANAKLYQEIKVTSKLGARRGKKKGGGGEAEVDAAADDAGGAKTPVLWLRVDPHGEWLADIVIHNLPEYMWSNLLDSSKDVVAQSCAIQSLAAMRPTSAGVVGVLRACLEKSEFYCRVRVEAAIALGATAGPETDWLGLTYLISFYRGRCFDPATSRYKSHAFTDLSEHIVNQSIPFAVAQVRDGGGCTPDDAVEFLLAVLRDNDNTHNCFDAHNFTATAVEALGLVCPTSVAMMQDVLHVIDRHVLREAVLPTPQHVVGCAALRAMTNLALQRQNRRRAPASVLVELVRLLQRHAVPAAPREMRSTAAQCILEICAVLPHTSQHGHGSLAELSQLLCAAPPSNTAGEAQHSKSETATSRLVDAISRLTLLGIAFVERERHVATREVVLETLLRLVSKKVGRLAAMVRGSAAAADGGDLDGAMSIAAVNNMDVLEKVHACIGAHSYPRQRHLAFMLLQRLACAPPIVHRAEDFDEPLPAPSAAAGPAISGSGIIGGSKRAGASLAKSVLPAASGVTNDSAGGAAAVNKGLKLKLRKSGVLADTKSAEPTASQPLSQGVTAPFNALPTSSAAAPAATAATPPSIAAASKGARAVAMDVAVSDVAAALKAVSEAERTVTASDAAAIHRENTIDTVTQPVLAAAAAAAAAAPSPAPSLQPSLAKRQHLDAQNISTLATSAAGSAAVAGKTVAMAAAVAGAATVATIPLSAAHQVIEAVPTTTGPGAGDKKEKKEKKKKEKKKHKKDRDKDKSRQVTETTMTVTASAVGDQEVDQPPPGRVAAAARPVNTVRIAPDTTVLAAAPPDPAPHLPQPPPTAAAAAAQGRFAAPQPRQHDPNAASNKRKRTTRMANNAQQNAAAMLGSSTAAAASPAQPLTSLQPSAPAEALQPPAASAPEAGPSATGFAITAAQAVQVTNTQSAAAASKTKRKRTSKSTPAVAAGQAAAAAGSQPGSQLPPDAAAAVARPTTALSMAVQSRLSKQAGAASQQAAGMHAVTFNHGSQRIPSAFDGASHQPMPTAVADTVPPTALGTANTSAAGAPAKRFKFVFGKGTASQVGSTQLSLQQAAPDAARVSTAKAGASKATAPTPSEAPSMDASQAKKPSLKIKLGGKSLAPSARMPSVQLSVAASSQSAAAAQGTLQASQEQPPAQQRAAKRSKKDKKAPKQK